MNGRDALLDRDFLKKLDEYNIREVYAKVISLNDWEQPVAEIIGSVQSGSIKVDGKSTLRRTCTLSLTTNKKYSITDVDWALHTKFRLYIGLKNFIDESYDDIIYFKMGVYVITAYNVSINEKGYTISISGNDKMCLLNGNVNGIIAAETDFGAEWTQIPNTNRYEKVSIPIKTIIRESIHEYGGEPYSNIVINDLDICGIELLSYRAKGNPMYVYNRSYNGLTTTQICFEDSTVGNIFKTKQSTSGAYAFRKKNVINAEGASTMIEIYQGDGLQFNVSGVTYTILKRADYGEAIGFRAVDLTYPSDLIGKVGDSLTSVLDKIVKMLGEFEYYYDIDGRFIFQRKKTYFDTSWTSARVSTESNGYTSKDEYYDSTAYTSANVYTFEGGKLITSYSNKPNLASIKNDYSIWGVMQGVKNNLAIHLRVALDVKPKVYHSDWHTFLLQRPAGERRDKWIEARGIIINSDVVNNERVNYTTAAYDWRELLYRMAKDSMELRKVITDLSDDLNNPYYVWDNNKCPNYRALSIKYLAMLEEYYNTLLNNGYASYYTDIYSFWPDLYRTERSPYIKYKYDESGNQVLDEYNHPKEDPDESFTENDWNDWFINGYWNPEYFRWTNSTNIVDIYNPDGLPFWIDFIDAEETNLYDYSVAKLGRRPKVVNDNTVKSIFVRETPNVLFIDPNLTSNERVRFEGDLHLTKLNIPVQYQNYLTRSSQGKSAKEVLDQLLYEGTFYNDTISISAIPVYYLEPNTRIKVYDEMTGIDGDYIINSISLSLAHDGLMTIGATRAEQRII